MPIVLPDETLARFRGSVKTLTNDEGRIGLAVSGGGDSLALLIVAVATMAERIDVATVDHGLRPEAANEAAFVGSICATFDVSHTVLRPSEPITGSLQTTARKVRYALLEKWAIERELAWIATAHHIDDQAETLMMRLVRGSGLAGLSAIRATNGRVIRPLLAWRRAELEHILAASAYQPVEDRSNDDVGFDRVRMRHALRDNDWIDPVALAKSATYLSDANEALDWSTQHEVKRRLSVDAAGVSLDPQNLPSEIVRRLVIIALALVNPDIRPRGAQITMLIEALSERGKFTLAGVMCSGGTIWHFTLAAPRRIK